MRPAWESNVLSQNMELLPMFLAQAGEERVRRLEPKGKEL